MLKQLQQGEPALGERFLDADNDTILARYAEWRGANVTPGSLKTYMNCVTMFQRAIGNIKFCDLTQDDVDQWKKTRWAQLKPKSIELDGGEVQRFLQWLGLLWGFGSPGEKVQFDVPRAKKDTLSRAEIIRERIIKKEEFDALYKAANLLRDKAMLMLLVDGGLRNSEQRALNKEDLFLDASIPHLKVRNGKGGKKRTVPLRPMTVKVLRRFLAERNWDYMDDKTPVFLSFASNSYSQRIGSDGLLQLINRLRERAGIKRKIVVHDFRHTAITWDAKEGVPISVMMQKYGHADLDTLQIYIHIAKDDVLQVYGKHYGYAVEGENGTAITPVEPEFCECGQPLLPGEICPICSRDEDVKTLEERVERLESLIKKQMRSHMELLKKLGEKSD